LPGFLDENEARVNVRRRLAPVVTGIAVLALWAGAFLKWGRGGPTEASPSRPGGDQEIKQQLDDLRTSVLGKNDETRGRKVSAPQTRPPKSAYDYTPREVCLQTKMTYPDRYKDVDCSSDKFSSPNGWIWTPGMR
jgi:hypothetical protein